MNINDAFPSKYLKAADLGGKKHKVQVQQVTNEQMGKDSKPVVYFFGKTKGLVLNKTKAMVLGEFFGPETDNWKGREFFIYPTKTQMEGKIVDAIGVEVVPEVVNEDAEDSFR